MKYYEIVGFIFMVQLSMAIVNAIHITQVTMQPNTDWFVKVDNSQLADEEYVQNQVTSNTDQLGLGDYVKGLLYFVTTLGLGIIAVPYTLAQFGIIYPFTYLLGIPVYFLYFLALAQWISNRPIKSFS